MDKIIVKGARENNLKNVSCEFPKEKFVVATGVSGSGKTSFAFDTIYKEGQRRYLESLSSYARQFIGDMGKPDCDSIEGLSPAISIDQKSGSKNPRSTVGTVTEIADYLRLLFARIGTPYCPHHHIKIEPLSIDEMVDDCLKYEGAKITVLSPLVRGEKGTFENLFEHLRHAGYSRVIVDNVMQSLDDEISLKKTLKHDISLVIDRLIVDAEDRLRISDAFSLALKESDGLVKIVINEDKEKTYSAKHSCPICGFSIPDLEPKLFSFNAPIGACPTCDGLGFKRHIDTDLLIPDKELSINGGALRKWSAEDNMSMLSLLAFMKNFNIDPNKPFKDLTDEEKNLILYGSDESYTYTYTSKSSKSVHQMQSVFEGVVNNLERRYLETSSRFIREWLEQYMVDNICPTCNGKRLNEAALSVYIDKYNIDDLSRMSIVKLSETLKSIKLTEREEKIAHMIIKEIINRLDFLANVGLDYLMLNRASNTLSGGEAQRIRLATQIGSKLTGIVYVLDEPSIGLHQKDNQKLINALKEMRDLGNTLLVVEHDTETIRSADYILDFGPNAGVNGGELVFSGTYDELIKNSNTLTAKYLRGDLNIEVPKNRLTPERGYISLKGAKCHNLKNVDVDFPIGLITYVTGVSGSGKSSLVNDCLSKGALKEINGKKIVPGDFDSLDLSTIDKVVVVDQSPIGRTPRSNPATYIGVFDEIRTLFASMSEAKARGYDKSRFSFNVKGGRCEYCGGDGVTRVEMNFLPDVFVECPVCHGTKYNKDTLDIKFKGKNIAEVLDLTIKEAIDFFENQPKILRQLKTIDSVGLGYVKLGQSSTTLSGGEAQRVKLAYELNTRISSNSLYILDEPSTGLHQDDIKKLLDVLYKIREAGATIVIIEHNLDMIKTADYIIDLGPKGGDEGGYIIAKGTPEELIKNKKSDTAKFLKDLL